jgi:hypothetical protein
VLSPSRPTTRGSSVRRAEQVLGPPTPASACCGQPTTARRSSALAATN